VAPQPVPDVKGTPASKSTPAKPQLPWFRLYTEFASDPNIQSLAFEDQRHFVVLMCLKGAGVLDREYPTPARRDAVVARGLGLDTASAVEAQRRLSDAGLLVGNGWEPKGWEVRQYQSDTSTPRTQKWRRERSGNVPGTAL
jgi:hypothetical protein